MTIGKLKLYRFSCAGIGFMAILYKWHIHRDGKPTTLTSPLHTVSAYIRLHGSGVYVVHGEQLNIGCYKCYVDLTV